MRVLLACDWFLKYVRPLAAAVAASGAEVAVLCRDHAHEFGESQAERRSELERLERASVRIFTVPGRVSSATSLPEVARVLRAVRAWRPDVVHAQESGDPRLLLAAHGLPIVLTVHDPAPHPGSPRRPRLDRLIRHTWRRRARRIVVHGNSLRAELAATIEPGRIAVVPHGTEPRERPWPVPHEPRVLFFGRLEAYKGLPVLVEAMRLVWRRRPEIRLSVLGSGPAAACLPRDERIDRSLGYVPEYAIERAFCEASLVVLPYLQGSQSGVGLLAIARGVPVIVTRVGSLPELVTNEDLVVEPADAPALAEAILGSIDHDGSLRHATLAHAQERFSWTEVAARSLAIYREVLAERSAA